MVLDCSTTNSSSSNVPGAEEPQDSPTDLCDPQRSDEYIFAIHVVWFGFSVWTSVQHSFVNLSLSLSSWRLAEEEILKLGCTWCVHWSGRDLDIDYFGLKITELYVCFMIELYATLWSQPISEVSCLFHRPCTMSKWGGWWRWGCHRLDMCTVLVAEIQEPEGRVCRRCE